MAIQKTQEALRGEERIQQLMEAFPELDRDLVIKTDLIREGVRPGPGSKLAGRWALPYAPWYFDYSHEDTHLAEAMTTQGYFLTPVIAHFSNGVPFQVMFDSRSPYEISYEEKGRYRLYRDGDPMEELFFPPRPQWYDRKTSTGRSMPAVIQQRSENNLVVAPLTYCEYGKDDRLCRYCNINASEASKKALGLERITAKREQDVYEVFMAAVPEVRPPSSITMTGGVILDSHKEAEVYARLLRALRRGMKDAGVEFFIHVLCQALEAEDQLMLKEAGASRVTHNLEVWDPRLFEIICPGKAKYVGRERWIEAVLRAKEINREGDTVCQFTSGVGLMHPQGFKSEDEDAASYLEGIEWMLAHGVQSYGVRMRPVPGTMFAHMAPPRTEYFLRMELAEYKLGLKYNLAPKPTSLPLNGNTIRLDLRYRGLQSERATGASPGTGPSGDVC